MTKTGDPGTPMTSTPPTLTKTKTTVSVILVAVAVAEAVEVVVDFSVSWDEGVVDSAGVPVGGVTTGGDTQPADRADSQTFTKPCFVCLICRCC